MSYIVQGYVFISIFLFIVKGNSQKKKTITLLGSIAISFVLKLSFDKTIIALLSKWITINYNSEWYYIGLIVFSAVLAYLFGRFAISKVSIKVLEFLAIPYTFNQDFWTDIYLQNDWFDIQLKDQDKHYLGKIDYVEENSTEPFVALIEYSIYDKNGNELDTTRADNEQSSIIIQLKDIEYIEAIKISPTKND